MEEKRRAVVALGMFDGVHRGHRALVERTVALAAEQNAVPAVYTFRNHPASVLGGSVKLLASPEERRALLVALGATDVRMEPFTKELAALSPEAFVEKLLGLWNVTAVVVGYNYTFGARGSGTPATLRTLGRRAGFSVQVLEPVRYGDGPVSSTRIREALERGDAASAAAMLGRPYTLSGTVVENRRIGRTIGFPTANLEAPAGRVLPATSVYATDAQTDAGTYRAVTNIGTNPTVGGTKLTVETHLIGFDGDLYGKQLAVSFLSRLRADRKFDTKEALRLQIAADVAAAETLENAIYIKNKNPDET